MRTLILMRHAKSSWDNAALSDHERPLNQRGRREAPVTGQRITSIGLSPEVVLSSDSTRTRETWDELCHLFPHLEPVFVHALYLGGLEDIRRAIYAQPDSVGSILCIGHNPGFSLTAGWLSGGHVMLKTSNAAILTSDAPSWLGSFERGAWSLTGHITPKTDRGPGDRLT